MSGLIRCWFGLHLPDRRPLGVRGGVLHGHCRRCSQAIYRDDAHDRWALEKAAS